MYDVKLPDGTWATTPLWGGVGLPAPECAEHRWEAVGPPRQPEQPGQPHHLVDHPLEFRAGAVYRLVRTEWPGDPLGVAVIENDAGEVA